MEFEKLQKIVKKTLNKNSLFELELIKSTNESYDFEEKELLTPEYNTNIEVNLRVTNEKGGFGVINFNDLKKAKEFSKLCEKISKTSEIDKDFKNLPEIKKKKIKLHSKNVENFELMKEVLEFKKHIKNEDFLRIINIGFSKTKNERFFTNSNNSKILKSTNNTVSFGIEVEKYNTPIYEGEVFHNKIDFFKTFNKVKKEIEIYKIKTKLKDGKYALLVDDSASRELFSATLFQRLNGFDFFKKRTNYEKNEKVMSNKISITNNPSKNYMTKSYEFDGEGSVSKKSTLINKGIVKNFLTDNYTSNLINQKNTNSCGSINSRPSIFYSNFLVKNGNKKFEKLTNSFKKIIRIQDISGEHMINPISGDLSTEARKAILYEDGEVVGKLDKAIISGNFYEMLKDVNGLENKSKEKYGFKIPKILFNEIKYFG